MKTFKFYGVCGNRYKLDDIIWEALEDESDGYRSYLDSVEIVENSNDIFFPDYLDIVTVEKVNTGNFDGYLIKSTKDNHIWLRFGTSDYNDYYPMFIFEYTPRPPKMTWEKFIN